MTTAEHPFARYAQHVPPAMTKALLDYNPDAATNVARVLEALYPHASDRERASALAVAYVGACLQQAAS